jgi:hypothetical protein
MINYILLIKLINQNQFENKKIKQRINILSHHLKIKKYQIIKAKLLKEKINSKIIFLKNQSILKVLRLIVLIYNRI